MYVQATLLFLSLTSLSLITLILLQAERAGALRHAPTARLFFSQKIG